MGSSSAHLFPRGCGVFLKSPCNILIAISPLSRISASLTLVERPSIQSSSRPKHRQGRYVSLSGILGGAQHTQSPKKILLAHSQNMDGARVFKMSIQILKGFTNWKERPAWNLIISRWKKRFNFSAMMSKICLSSKLIPSDPKYGLQVVLCTTFR